MYNGFYLYDFTKSASKLLDIRCLASNVKCIIHFFCCCKSTCFWVLLKAFGSLHSHAVHKYYFAPPMHYRSVSGSVDGVRTGLQRAFNGSEVVCILPG